MLFQAGQCQYSAFHARGQQRDSNWPSVVCVFLLTHHKQASSESSMLKCFQVNRKKQITHTQTKKNGFAIQ